MEPFISIIMPVFNNEIYLQNAVSSVLNQSFKEIELIIVDDGSTDQTPAIADAIALTDSRVKVIHQKNQWIYASFNNGIQAASGIYGYIVNSDDRLEEGILEVLSELAKKYQPDVIWTKALNHICNEKQEILEFDCTNVNDKIQKDFCWNDTGSVRMHWLDLLKYRINMEQANLYRLELMKRHPFRNDWYGADFLYNISIASEVTSCYILARPAYAHYIYLTPHGNASVGRYYGYEHEMFDEFYFSYVKLYRAWGLYDKKTARFLLSMRLQYMNTEFAALMAKNCSLSVEEKVYRALNKWITPDVYQSAAAENLSEEFEHRVIAGLRDILSDSPADRKSSIYFVQEMLDASLSRKKGTADIEKIRAGVYHHLNPYQIGKSFLDRLNMAEHRNPLLLYGAGLQGEKYMRRLSKEWNIAGFCDGSSKKAGSVYCGKTVYSPEELKQFPDASIFITVLDTQSVNEIKNRLESLGIKKERIVEDIM